MLTAADGDVDTDDRLADILATRLEEVDGRPAGSAEQTAWQRSLAALARVLAAPAFAAGELFVELFMPLNGRRCDVLLTGKTADGRRLYPKAGKDFAASNGRHSSEHPPTRRGVVSMRMARRW